LDTALIATTATATDTVTVPGVVLGDMVLGMSVGVSEAGLVRRAYVSAADTVTIVSYNPTVGDVNLASTTLQLIIGRAVV
jgi:hypothetical protein